MQDPVTVLVAAFSWAPADSSKTWHFPALINLVSSIKQR